MEVLPFQQHLSILLHVHAYKGLFFVFRIPRIQNYTIGKLQDLRECKNLMMLKMMIKKFVQLEICSDRIQEIDL